MDWKTEINLGGFGSGAEMEWKIVKSWSSFKPLFEDAVHIDAVTYCESPDLFIDLFKEHAEKLESIDVLIGDKEEYRSEIDNVAVARELERYYREDKLTIRLRESTRQTIHSKLFRIVKPDDKVSLIAGSVNFSKNGMRNQTNTITIFHTDVGSQLDQQFQTWIQDHRDDYGHEIFLENLSERLEQTDDEEEKEKQIELWIDNRDAQLTERGEVHSTVSEEFENVAEDADKIVSVEDDPDDPDETIELQHEHIEPEDDQTENENADGSEGVTAARTQDYSITLSTQGFDTDGYLSEMKSDLKRRGAEVGSNSLTTSVRGYTNYLKTRYDVPKMWINDDRRQVHLQHGEHHRILTAKQDPDPDTLDDALANIEAYMETVDEWGETNNETAVKAHMYEGVLYGLWAPFVNLYAQQFYGSVTLDNALQYLYIFGETNAGKDKFTEFILRLISDGLVRDGAAADKIGKGDITALRNIDTIFPYVISDIKKKKIERFDPLRDFWEDDWTPDKGISYPTIIFTSNDSRPNDWFRSRSKMLHFDVAFPARPEDDGFIGAQKDLNSILDAENPIFAFVAQRILQDEKYKQSGGTVDDVRQIFLEFYDVADRKVPSYFPREPANSEYNIGKRKWRQAYERGDVTFNRQNNHLIAAFDSEPRELYTFKKTLPTKMRPEKSGSDIIIKNPDGFNEWFYTDDLEKESINEDSKRGILDRLLP